MTTKNLPGGDRLPLSANLGFLFTDRPLPEAIRSAAAAGFDAVELHWPYQTPAEEIASALAETGLPLLGLNTLRGDVGKGDNGLSAIPGREDEARAAIDQAIAYAAATGCGKVHVMAGKATGQAAFDCFVANLKYADARAAEHGIGLVIEPLNRRDAPGYFLYTLDCGLKLLDTVGSDRLGIMFDCYHMQIEGGDLLTRFRNHQDRIGHVQFAGVPDRGDPGRGEVDFAWLLPAMRDAGWQTPFGAEYKPAGRTEDGLGWMAAYR